MRNLVKLGKSDKSDSASQGSKDFLVTGIMGACGRLGTGLQRRLSSPQWSHHTEATNNHSKGHSDPHDPEYSLLRSIIRQLCHRHEHKEGKFRSCFTNSQ